MRTWELPRPHVEGGAIGTATTEDTMVLPRGQKIVLPYDPAIPLTGMYLEEMKSLFFF